MKTLRLILKDIASDLFDWGLILAMAVGILILSASAPAHATDSEWVEIGSSATASLYIAPDRIRAVGSGSPEVWMTFAASQISQEGRATTVALVRFDCAAGMSRVLAETQHKSNGSVLRQFRIQPAAYVVPGSLFDTTSQIVCQIDKSAAAKSVKARE